MKKKILFYNGSLRMGGIERVMIEVLQNIDLRKYDIDLLIMDEFEKENVFRNDVPKEIKVDYLVSEATLRKTMEYRENRKKSIFARIMFNYMMWKQQQEKKKSLKKFSEKKYDVVIDFDMGLSKNIDLIKADKKLAWVHASIKNWYEKPDRIKRLGERLKKYDKIVTICDAMKEETENLYPFLKDKLVRIYNPFNFNRIEKLSKEIDDLTDAQRKMLESDYIVTVMRLTTHQKDFDTLIKGMKIFYEKNSSNLKLYILGDGPDRDKVEELIKNSGLEEKVILIGNVKNPYPWIRNSKFMVHSSKYEGLPTVLIEAMILNKIIISSDCPTGPKEILENGKVGYLYSVGDFNKLVEGIELFIKNPKKNVELSNEIKASKMRFISEEILKKYERIIDSKN